MMLIFEEIQKNTSDSVYQKPPPSPLIRTCIVWDDFQGNKEKIRLREAVNFQSRELLSPLLPGLESQFI